MRTRENLSPRDWRCPRRRKTIRKPRKSDARFSRNSANALGQFSQVRINIEVVPKLGSYDGDKAGFDGETRQAGWHLAESSPPVMHRGGVEIAAAAQGFSA